MLFDTHAHYNDSKFEQDANEVINNAYNSGVKLIVNIGYDIETSKKAVEQANNYDFMYASVGIHPEEVANKESIDQIEQLAKNKKVVAIGEIGLDYYWNKENKDLQKKYFIEQIDLANKLKLPIIIHDRDAHGDTLDIIREHKALYGGVFHCFAGSVEMAEELIKMGYFISFTGAITFNNAKKSLEVVKVIPLDKIVIETDSPYLTPHPYRGQRNDSSYVKYVAQKISEIKDISLEDVEKITFENGKKLFNIYA